MIMMENTLEDRNYEHVRQNDSVVRWRRVERDGEREKKDENEMKM